MPTEDGEFIIPTQEELFQRQREALEAQFDQASVGFGDYTRRILNAQAKTLAENQYEALQAVYRGAYLEDATDEELSKLVRLIGLSRREPVPATGLVRFKHDGPVTQDYLIQKGTTVSTGGSDAIDFDVSEKRTLALLDSAEDGDITEYTGDTGSFNAIDMTSDISLPSPPDGDWAIEASATAGVKIWRDDHTPTWGTKFEFAPYMNASTKLAFIFGVDDDASDYYAAVVDDTGDQIAIERVEGGSSTTLETTSVSITTGEFEHGTVDWNTTGEIVFTLYDSEAKDTERASVSTTESTPHRTGGGFGIRKDDANDVAYVDWLSESEVSVNVKAVEGGIETNVGAGSIDVLSDGTTGIDDISNPFPTGDNSYVDTLEREFQVGRDRETDDELRERAFESTELGGAGTEQAIHAALRKLDGVFSVTIFENETDTDNTGSGGLPAHSFEAVVYGGQSQSIAEALHSTQAITARDYGGAHGTAESYTFYSEELEEEVTYEWTTPPILDLDITVDLVKDDTYVGDDEIRSRIVQYIGGTDTDGATIGGLDVSEDVYVGVLEDVVVGPSDTGVYDADFTTIDKDGDTTDDTTTAASGAEILDVGESEVAETNARDGSITINTSDIS